MCFPCFPVYLCFMQKSKDNPKLSGKNNCAPIKPAFPLYRQKPIFMVSCPKLAFPWKKPGANCVFPWISWSQKPQTCIPWEKPIRTWVRIVFSHGFMGSEAPNLHLFGKTYIRTWVRIVFSHRFRCNNSNPKPVFALGKTNWELGGGLGWWGGVLCISNDLKRTSNGP